MGGPRGDKLQEFNPFGPKVIAGIGDFAPDTVTDRSIMIRLQRKAADEPVERFRRRLVEEEAESLRVGLESALDSLDVALSEAWPHLPDALHDRAQDTWEPLLAVAEAAGGLWPQRARIAAVELSHGPGGGEESLRLQLLADIAAIWPPDRDKLFTADLLELLHAVDESPWGEWNITAHRVARMLKPFDLSSRKVRIGAETRQGWRRDDLQPVIRRYLPDSKWNTGTFVTGQGESPDLKWNITEEAERPNPLQDKDSSDVPLQEPEQAENGGGDGIPLCLACGLRNTSSEPVHPTCPFPVEEVAE
jgi:hypothetical protein